MKNVVSRLVMLVLIGISLSNHCLSQDIYNKELEYEVYKIYPAISISKENLIKADSLGHLNKNYNSTWVKEFISVNILTYHEGKLRKTVGKNDVLTPEQKKNINQADVSTKINVIVKYIPDNSLKFNDVKELNFSVTVTPENDAEYLEGKQKLKQYIKENAIDKIPDAIFGQYQLAAIKFTIDEAGQVADVHVSWQSDDEKIDQLLVETICNMPRWKPAQYSNGLKVKQEFALAVGDMKSCAINTLNIYKGWPE